MASLLINQILYNLAPVESEPDVLLAWNYCAEKSYSVEIVYRNQENDEGILTKAYFDMDYKVTENWQWQYNDCDA